MKQKEKEGASAHECQELISACVADSDSRVNATLEHRLSAVGGFPPQGRDTHELGQQLGIPCL